jgi:hypothetical protein
MLQAGRAGEMKLAALGHALQIEVANQFVIQS